MSRLTAAWQGTGSASTSAVDALPSLDLSVLELGLRRFLDQLDRAISPFAEERVLTGLYLWIAAGAVAVAACEIGRRQFRASVDRSADGVDGVLSENLFER